MDKIQSLLFGQFPRAMGVTTPDSEDTELQQFLVHSESEFDGVLDKTAGERNLYSSISAFEPVNDGDEFVGSAVRSDKVSIDFDSSAKAEGRAKGEEESPNWSHPMIPPHATDAEVIRHMRDEPEIAEAVLADLCEDARRLAEECISRDMPFVGVFSGFGLHIHLLHSETMSRVGDKMLSTCNKIVSELSLSCADEAASGRPFRIMRIPNVERVCHDEDAATGLYTIPFSQDEVSGITPQYIVEQSMEPRYPSLSVGDRPEMSVQEDYLGPGYEDGVGQEKMRPTPEGQVGDELTRQIIKQVVKMPCVYERAFGRNPPNDVRVKLGIMLLNAGYSVRECTDLIAKLNWADFDRETTKYQLKQLKKNGKGDWACRTMRAKGLCVRADDPRSCEMYGYRGGNSPSEAIWQ